MKGLVRGAVLLLGALAGTARAGQNDPFTVIFLSDLESNYRGHTVDHAKRVVTYVKNLKHENMHFDGSYAGHKVDPKLVVHGGDNTVDAWSCKMFWGCRDPSDEYKDVWNQLYDAGISMISAFGNHDWAVLSDPDELWGKSYPDGEKTQSNKKTLLFVDQSFEKTKPVAARQGASYSYRSFPPKGKVGQSTKIAVYRGVQISMHMQHASTESYDSQSVTYPADEQFAAHSAALDRSKPTLFVSHFPISHVPGAGKDKMKNLIWQFNNGAAHFSGHTHNEKVTTYTNSRGASFKDYTAAYPHIWHGKKPGAYAILVSPTQGILQVKSIELKPKCWQPGTQCVPGVTCKTDCCDNDSNSQFWYTKAFWACGKETLPEKFPCIPSSTCKRCKNGEYDFWEGLQMHACGKETCWHKDTTCYSFVSCDNCCRPAKCPWYWFGFCKCGRG